MRRILVLLILAAALFAPAARMEGAQSDTLAGLYDPDTGEFDSLTAINLVIGANLFYNSGYFGQRTNVANVESGHIWMGHDVFDRSGAVAFAASYGITDLPAAPAISEIDGGGAVGEFDYHATMVGSVLAGFGLTPDGDLGALQAGIAPLSTLWSGAIATSFVTDPESPDLGSFEISKASFLVPYHAFFEGTTVTKNGVTQIVPKADVINSSWGFEDPAGTDEYTQILDGLAFANPTVTLVKSAGNSGPTAAPGGPGSGYNGITVGALGGGEGSDPYLQPSDYTSSAPGDFYNPVTGVTVTGVRAAVDIAAPGDNFALAAYLGKTGTLTEVLDEDNPATDRYFVNASGTSFASPVVAGAVSLLKDVSYGGDLLVDQPEARDTRVIKSVIMAGATATTGWDNGQHFAGHVVTTTQALDYATGAGRINLVTTAAIYTGYTGGTTDVPGDVGGVIHSVGWDLGTVARSGNNDYFFDLSFSGGLELDVSLNWFVNVTFDSLNETAQSESFANLDLEVWTITDGAFGSLVAQSATLYNNTEFLRFLLPQTGSYGLRVKFGDVAYERPGSSLTSETYGLAWQVVAPVPEPEAWSVVIALGLVVMVWNRRRKIVSNAR